MRIDYAGVDVPWVVQGVVGLVPTEVNRIDENTGSGERPHRREPQSSPTQQERQNRQGERRDTEHHWKVIDEEVRIWPGEHSVVVSPCQSWGVTEAELSARSLRANGGSCCARPCEK